ncbi:MULTISPECIES: MFS transporter [Amycolatopsis]|uniref:Putative MFS family arabinose efflux permease n=1 Tax=Amycolatopsis thermoflava TaxID=84480 RepID=A0A3N2H136_9PSEU|nr:MFS transporter [Amycolatopsis thermoflava]ROS42634.1 putative MFS family arabinose efflux permease [Amycolatopsis thermoflava]
MEEIRLRRALIGMCGTQVVSWGALYYALPVATAQIAGTTGWTPGTITLAFSAGLLVAAVAGIPVGRLLDRYGPRPVMTAGSALAAVALVLVATAPSRPLFFLAWVVVGVAQAMQLYPPVFAAITCWYGERRARPLTVVTLVGGLASTVFAPLTALLVDQVGWRASYLVYAAVFLLVNLPVHWLLLTPAWPDHRTRPAATPVRQVTRSARFRLLQTAMTLAALGLYASAIVVVPLFVERGLSHAVASVALGLVGAGQVLGRLVFAAVPRTSAPASRTVGVLAASCAALVLLALLPGPAGALLAVAVVLGMARGAYTLVQATAVADRWTTARFGALNGMFTAPITAATAIAPGGAIVLAERVGGYSTALILLAVLAAGAAVLAAFT